MTDAERDEILEEAARFVETHAFEQPGFFAPRRVIERRTCAGRIFADLVRSLKGKQC